MSYEEFCKQNGTVPSSVEQSTVQPESSKEETTSQVPIEPVPETQSTQESTVSSVPEATTGQVPEVTNGPIPEVSAGPVPEVTTGPVPEVTSVPSGNSTQQ